ncbi:MAG: AraC family transcriptional regulator [Bacteroidia bacterium]|nr:AraC family transcriptional regulator [Bacteroidia bacterium]
MTFYEQKLIRIKALCYSNQGQIDRLILLRKYIRQHFDQKLDLDHLSQIACMSKYHLLRIFKHYYGQSIHQYQISLRIEKAKDLIRQGHKIGETCYAIGFESPASFSRLFKDRIGCSPSSFRKAQFSTRFYGDKS